MLVSSITKYSHTPWKKQFSSIKWHFSSTRVCFIHNQRQQETQLPPFESGRGALWGPWHGAGRRERDWRSWQRTCGWRHAARARRAGASGWSLLRWVRPLIGYVLCVVRLWMAVASGTRINRPPARDPIYSVQEIYFGKIRHMHLHCEHIWTLFYFSWKSV